MQKLLMFVSMSMWGMLCECVYYIYIYGYVCIFLCMLGTCECVCIHIYIYVIHTCISVYKDKNPWARACMFVCVCLLACPRLFVCDNVKTLTKKEGNYMLNNNRATSSMLEQLFACFV